MRRARSAGGFSLIEVMVAFTILGIGLLSVAAAQVKAIHGTQSGRHLTQSSIVAQTQLETLARDSWTNLAVWLTCMITDTQPEDKVGSILIFVLIVAPFTAP